MRTFFLSLKAKVVYLFIILFCSTLGLDYLIFEKFYFYFPNEMEWDSSPWYNFASLRRTLKEESNSKKVLFVGSSVALYSVLPHKMFADTNIKGHFYSHVAMAPSDFYYYKSDIQKSNPSLVVYLLNFADLQWEYLDEKDGKLIFNDRKWIDEFSDRYPAKTFYPKEFYDDFSSSLDKKQSVRLISKYLLYVNRYRSFFFDPIETWFENHFRSGRSFQRYAGSMPIEGIWSKGWTKSEATLHCEMNSGSEDSIFILKKNTIIDVSIFKENSELLNKQGSVPLASVNLNFDKTGWIRFPWEKFENYSSKNMMIKLKIKQGMGTAKEANIYHKGFDFPVGVRLSHYFCKTPDFNDVSYVRESFYDEKRFSEMSDSVYDEDYKQRILDDADKRPELRRLNTLHIKKREVKDLVFEPWFEFNRINSLSEYFKEKNIPFIVVLSPENPIESKTYVDGRWFEDLRKYLSENLTKNGQMLVDHTNSISTKQMFFDPHHLTYDGALLFNSLLEKEILRLISEKKNEKDK
ncbi:MAG: hypothetical protein SH817_08900 [Leptospira sp.]|nr:hypothetical protein [Leptospira sp.]